jgi:hypothetical protein
MRKSILLLLDSRGYAPSEDELQRIENEHNKSMGQNSCQPRSGPRVS